MTQIGKSRQREGRGLVVENIGGRLGWLARRYIPSLSTQAYLLLMGWKMSGRAKRHIDWFTAQPETPWFTHVEVETVNRCNGECAFCPVNRKADPRPPVRIDEALFTDIVDQLASLRYAGTLGLYSNNEPLLDPRLVDFAAIARDKLPDAHIYITTNGSLLTPDLFRRLMPHLDRMVVNNYASTPAMHPNIREFHDFCLSGEGRRLIDGKTVVISLRCREDVLSSRAGNSPNRRPPSRPPAASCVLPFSQFIVRPDGMVSLCCNDALGQVTLGDLNRQSMAEIWRGAAFADVRRAMAASGRSALPLCRACDFFKWEF